MRRIREASDQPHRVFMARLAEAYDGIGQYVMVQLASSSVSGAYKARVAAGDFGGKRTFPAGTRVPVISIHGKLEVLLGNLARGVDFICGGLPTRVWSLPFEYLCRLRIIFDNSDRVMRTDIDLLDGFPTPGFGGQNVILAIQNIGTTKVELIYWLDVETSGFWTHPGGGEPLLSSNYPSGAYFWVRGRVEQDIGRVRAWMDSDLEPSTWGWEVTRDADSVWVPQLEHTLYWSAEHRGDPVTNSIQMDSISIIQGFGPSVDVDTFNRSISVGLGQPELNPSLGWKNTVVGEDVLYLVDGSNGVFRRTSSGQSLSSVQTTRIFNSISCEENFNREVPSGSWGTSEFGPDWGGELGGLSVTDGYGYISASVNSGTDVLIPTSLPLECLIRWRFIGVIPDLSVAFGFTLDDPDENSTFSYMEYDRNVSGSNDVLAGNNNNDGSVASINLPNGTWAFMKAKVTADEVSMKVWAEGSDEPDYQLVVTGSAWTTRPVRLSPYGAPLAGAGGGGTTVEIDYIKVLTGTLVN